MSKTIIGNNMEQNFKADDFAVIRVEDGSVHLETTWNPDASCCEDGDVVQREVYSSSGWNESKDNPELASDFWGVWTEWNGKMCGGVYLDDGCGLADMEKEIASHPIVRPSDIAGLSDGVYSVECPIGF